MVKNEKFTSWRFVSREGFRNVNKINIFPRGVPIPYKKLQCCNI